MGNLHLGEYNAPIYNEQALIRRQHCEMRHILKKFVSYGGANQSTNHLLNFFTVNFACHKTMNNKRIQNDSQSLNYFMIVAPQQQDFV